MSDLDQLARLLAQDDANRERALALESFIVEAPAGAGKTELLTQRVLRLLATVADPEEVVAITFTNKAAGEMRERIHLALTAARSGLRPGPDAAHKQKTFDLACAVLQRDAELGWALERQFTRLRLTTIDAFCASLARQMPLLSRFGAQPAIADEARRHYDEAARRTLDHLERDPSPEAEALATVLEHLDNDSTRLVRLLADMLARREQWRALWRAGLDHPEAAVAQALQAMVAVALGEIAAQLNTAWQRTVMPLARFAADQLGGTALTDWSAALATDLADLPRWRALTGLLLTGEGEKRKLVNVRNGFPKEAKAEKAAIMAVIEALTERQIEALRTLRTLPEPDAADDAVVRALVAVLKVAAAELWLVFREHGEVDFSELSMRALDALGTARMVGTEAGEAGEPSNMPTDLALRLDYQISHLLVDEFQDTSPSQVRLLEALTAGWQQGDGRTLFLVGDPMQSIYRFRKADVGLFLQVQQRGIGDLPLQALRLSRNNRSDPQIVGWINQAFPTLFPVQDEAIRGRIRYRPFVATRACVASAQVKTHVLTVGSNESLGSVRAREAQRILDIIVATRRDDPKQTIAVLVRARNHLSGLVAALRRHTDMETLAFSAVEVEPLIGRQGVQDLISLTKALHHRGDRVHWLAVLRAPWCGLTLADLHALAADDHQATIWQLMNDGARVAQLSQDGQRRLAHVRCVMAEALAGQGRQRRRRWLEDVWRKLGGEGCVGGAGATGLADAQAFFARLDALDAQGRFVLDTLEADMSALYAAADARSEGHIQLMTIHKSKGLEFDTVIVPGLDRVGQGGDAPLLIWDEFALPEGESLVAAPINARQGKSDVPTAYDYLRGLERERSANEDVRVLYVAATRAVSALHWVGVMSRDAAGVPELPRTGSALSYLWPALSAEMGATSVGELDEVDSGSGEELSGFVPELVRLATPRVPAPWVAPAALEPSVFSEAEPALDAFAAAVGTLIHACLEQAAQAMPPWDEAKTASLMPALVRWLSSRGWSAEQSLAGAKRARYCLVQTLLASEGQWVLAQHVDGAAELVLSQVGAGGTAIIRVVDRCFIADGVRWVIDYKSADLGMAPAEHEFQSHAQRYCEQLAGYAQLFAEEGLPVRCAILYVAYGKLICLD